MKRHVKVIRELKTGRLITDRVKQVIQIYDAMTYMDFLAFALGNWLFLQLDVPR